MPKIVDHDEQRRTLLLHCFDLFKRRGYHSVTLREIAREIGASTGTLYHYFPNKLAILEQLYELAIQDDLGAVQEAAARGIGRRERLRRLTEVWERGEAKHEGLLLLALDLYRNSPDHSRRLLSGYAARYKKAIATSLDIEPELADAVFTYLLGANIHALLTPGLYSFKAQARNVERVLAGGPFPGLSRPRAARRRPEKPGRAGHRRRGR